MDSHLWEWIERYGSILFFLLFYLVPWRKLVTAWVQKQQDDQAAAAAEKWSVDDGALEEASPWEQALSEPLSEELARRLGVEEAAPAAPPSAQPQPPPVAVAPGVSRASRPPKPSKVPRKPEVAPHLITRDRVQRALVWQAALSPRRR